MTVQAGFNGVMKPMLVNTGAGISMMRESALAPLGLHGIQNSSITMLGSGGGASRSFVQVEDFGVGAIRAPRVQFQVAPGSGGEADTVGSLGGDILSVYDVEIDPAGRKLNFFAKDHCPGHVLYWHPTAVAVLPITTQLATGDRSRTGFHSYIEREKKIYVPVTLDGKDFQAMINTGSQASTMSAATAKFQYGVTADSPGSTILNAVAGRRCRPCHLHAHLPDPDLRYRHGHQRALRDLSRPHRCPRPGQFQPHRYPHPKDR